MNVSIVIIEFHIIESIAIFHNIKYYKIYT